MSEVLERIWAEFDGDNIIIHKDGSLAWTGYLHEYIRADIHKALEAENARLRQKLSGEIPLEAGRE